MELEKCIEQGFKVSGALMPGLSLIGLYEIVGLCGSTDDWPGPVAITLGWYGVKLFASLFDENFKDSWLQEIYGWKAGAYTYKLTRREDL